MFHFGFAIMLSAIFKTHFYHKDTQIVPSQSEDMHTLEQRLMQYGLTSRNKPSEAYHELQSINEAVIKEGKPIHASGHIQQGLRSI